MYYRNIKQAKLISSLHVDGIFIFSNDEQENLTLKNQFSSESAIKDFGNVNTILSLRVTRNKDTAIGIRDIAEIFIRLIFSDI